MIEIKSKNKQTEFIEDKNPKVDLSLFRKQSNSKTASGIILSDLNKVRKQGNMDFIIYLQELYERVKRLEKVENIEIEKWKGTSDIFITEFPSKVVAYKWQKADRDSKPRKVLFEFTKKQISHILYALRLTKKEKGIEFTSKDLAKYYFKLEKCYYSKKHKPLFSGHQFIWENLFTSRMEHCKYTILLQILRKWGLIEYGARGKIKLLKN